MRKIEMLIYGSSISGSVDFAAVTGIYMTEGRKSVWSNYLPVDQERPGVGEQSP